MADDSPKDPYAPARDNMRATVKWLTGTFAAIAAVILAGTSVSGLGKIPHGLPLIVAAACLFGAFVFVCIAVNVCLGTMRSDAFYLSNFTLNAKGEVVPIAGLDPVEERELSAVAKDIVRHQGDLMPAELPSFALYLTAIGSARARVTQAANAWSAAAIHGADEAALRANLQTEQDNLKSVLAVLPGLLWYGSYRQLYVRIQGSMTRLLALGIAALVCLGVYGFIASGSSKEGEPKTVIIAN